MSSPGYFLSHLWLIPLFPLADATLTALAAGTLRAPEIDVSRLIETYTEPLLREAVR